MATLGELNIFLKLKGSSEVKSGLDDLTKNLKRMNTDLRQLQTATQAFGVAITGTFGAAFKVASKIIPEVNHGLNQLQDASKEVSNTLAKAALPALNEIIGSLNHFSNILKNTNPKVIETVFRVGSVSLAIAGLTKALRSLVSLFVFLSRPVGLIVAALSAITFLIVKFRDEITKSIPALKGLFDWFEKIFGSDSALDRGKTILQEFGTGFTSQLRKLRDEVSRFGQEVAKALEQSLGDTLFDTITGRIKGLRSVLKSLGEDILRAFTHGVSNQFLGLIFGNQSGGAGILGKVFPGLAKLLGFSTGDPMEKLKKKTDEVAEKFGRLSINMDRFAAAKDRAIQALQRGSGGGAIAGPGGFAAGMISPISPETIQSAGLLTGIFGAMAQSVGMVNSGIKKMGKDLIGVIFGGVAAAVGANAILVALGAVTAAIITGITTAAASTIAAAWLPAALFASIATFGAAAAVGTAALAGATATLGAIGGGASAVSRAAFGGNQGLPSGANITMGSGGVEGLAEGGIVRKPGIFMVGESGPEAVVPLNKSGGIGGAIVIQSDIVFADDPSSIDKFVRAIEKGLIRRSDRRTGGTALAF